MDLEGKRLPREDSSYGSEEVLVTPEARERLCASEIWFHLGGYSEDGDSYDTQQWDVERELDHFWADLVGPDEYFRSRLMEAMREVKGEWRLVTITFQGAVSIQFADGTSKTLRSAATQPPE